MFLFDKANALILINEEKTVSDGTSCQLQRLKLKKSTRHHISFSAFVLKRSHPVGKRPR